ncbi:hypothetical protein Pla52o_11990 [Novipirellula galeiformis]|uniref:Uncharacterized protein n=1 Tax=Novipirellula galeiformis TaxID=2528004 RepID=A0A5C6CJ94_9BACT|nr:hypothetical protein Pla52o_11990 [Novipirellula galeiformis]
MTIAASTETDEHSQASVGNAGGQRRRATLGNG